MAGVTVLAWYPITPSSSLAESLIDYARALPAWIPRPGSPPCAIVQAEDELAAAGMVHGRRLGGRARDDDDVRARHLADVGVRRASGYYAEVPAVIVDVQRVGPSTGLPTRTMQGDILSTYFLSHGDAKHILRHPGLGRGVLRARDGCLRPGGAASRRRCS